MRFKEIVKQDGHSSNGLAAELPNSHHQLLCPQHELNKLALKGALYRDRLKSMQILLSRTRTKPGRTGKQEQEQSSRNPVQTL